MDVKLLHQGSNEGTAILFFSGWSAPHSLALEMELPEEWTLFSVGDYRGELPQWPDMSCFSRLYLVAWSMGVWAAEYFHKCYPAPSLAVAINGTPSLISDRYGIKGVDYQRMATGLDVEGYRHFVRQMCLSEETAAHFLSLPDHRGITAAREELRWVGDLGGSVTECEVPWTRAIVSDHDLVIPSGGQRRFWSDRSIPIEELPTAPHLILGTYIKSWRELLRL